ncbi:MAG: 30S ribosomal protein S13 [Minisyncoccia bacterium]
MRISGITLPDNKHIAYSLTALYGVGLSRAQQICAEAGVDPMLKTSTLTPEQENSLRKLVERYKTEGDLKREVAANIKRLRDIGSYRGLRHQRRLPVRGQRTKTNSRTVRGNVRRTMGSGRRKLEKT